jgi:hypothetical protein
MSIRIINEDGQDVPTLFCDTCGKPIKHAQDGNYVWDEIKDSPLLFEHKVCSRRNLHPYSGELSWLPVYLVNSLAIDWKQASEDASLMARL